MTATISIAVLAGDALFAALGYAARRIVERRSGPKPYKEPKQPKAICGCEHHFAIHGNDGCHSVSHAVVARSGPIKDFDGESIIGYKEETFGQVACPCKRYTGPEPLNPYYAPELGS